MLYGAVALAATPVFSAAAALQGVPEKDRAAAASVVQGVSDSTNWLGVFEDEVRRRTSKAGRRDLSMAPKPDHGLVNPAWKGRYDAVLAVDFSDPVLRGNGSVNSDLWVETRVYWTLIDPVTGASIAGGPAIAQSSRRQSFVKWSREGARALNEAFIQSTHQAAGLVADAAFPSSPRAKEE